MMPRSGLDEGILGTHGRWRVASRRVQGGGEALVVVSPTGITDWPQRYHDGRIAYDAPEAVPREVKAAVRSAFDAMRQSGTTARNDALAGTDDDQEERLSPWKLGMWILLVSGVLVASPWLGRLAMAVKRKADLEQLCREVDGYTVHCRAR